MDGGGRNWYQSGWRRKELVPKWMEEEGTGTKVDGGGRNWYQSGWRKKERMETGTKERQLARSNPR